VNLNIFTCVEKTELETYISFYSATNDQKASYKSQQNTILYSAYIHTCVYTSHIHRPTYTHIHTLSQQRCWKHHFKFK